MPRIPVRQPVGPGQVRAVRADTGGAAMSRLGQQVTALGTQMEKARQSRETNEAVTAYTRQTQDFEDGLKKDSANAAQWEQLNNESHTDRRAEFVDTIDDQVVRDSVTARINTIQLHSEVRVRQGARGMEIKEGRAAIAAMGDVLSDNYAKSISDADRGMILEGFEDATDAAVANGIITPKEGVDSLEAFTTGAEKLRALYDIEEDPEAMLANIDNYGLAPDDQLVVKGQAEREVARNLAARKAEAAKRQQLVQTSLYDGIQSGDAGRADLDRAYNTFDPETNMRQLSEPGYRALLGQLRTYEKDQAKLNKSFNLYETSLESGEALDYKIKDHRDAAEAGFLRLVPKLAPMEPVEKNTAIINDLRVTKIWPKSLQSQMRVAAKSGDLETIENFSNLYDRASSDKSVSAVNKSMVSDDQAFWETVGSLKRAGTLSNKAIEVAQHNAFELTDDDRAAFKQRYKDKKYALGNGDQIRQITTDLMSEMDLDFVTEAKLFFGIEDAPTLPPGMEADYQNLTRLFFDKTGGNIELARSIARENVMRAWAVEEIEDEL